MKKLLEQGKIEKRISGKFTYYSLLKSNFSLNYLKKPFFEREEKKYNYEFLENYKPNKSSFLTENQKKLLFEKSCSLEINTNYYKENKRSLENLLIDFSYMK